MSTATDALGIALGVIIPAVQHALEGGTPVEIVSHAAAQAAHDVALRRIEHAHPGEDVSRLAIEAERQADGAARLRELGWETEARQIDRIVARLRAEDGTTPTDPAPTRDDEPTRREP